MSRGWKWTLGVAASLILVIGAIVLVFQWNWLRQPAIDALSKATGRTVGIEQLSGEWALQPRIVLREFHIANAEWGREPEIVSAERIEIVVDLPELLRGRTVLPEIRLVRPKVSLEQREDGTNNWTMGAEDAAEVAAPEERDEFPLIGLLVIEDGHLVYRDEKAELDINAQISTAIGEGQEGEGEVHLEGNGVIHGERFTLKAKAGSLLALREEDDPYPLTLEVVIGPTRGRISGTLAEPVKFEGLDLDVSLSGPNLGRLTQVSGVPLPMTPPYDLKGRLQRDGQVWSVTGTTGKVGQSDLNGDILIDLGRERLYLEADLRSKVLDYRDVGPLIGIEAEVAEPPKPEAAKAPTGPRQPEPRQETRKPPAEDQGPAPRVLPDVPLAVEQVRQVDAKVKFRGDKVEAPSTPLSGVDLNLIMQNGVLQIDPLRLGVAGGYISSAIRIDAKQPTVVTDYDIRLSGFELRRFLAEIGQEKAGAGQMNGRIRLRGYGDAVRSSLGSATGDVRMTMNGGELSNLVLELIGLDVGQAALFLAEGDRGETTVPLRCFIADFQVENGVMTPRTFVLDTTDTTVTADGQISLKDERLGFRLTAHPKDPSLLSARTPITINGAFSRPQVGVNPAPLGARAAGAVALGVLLTPLASILAFIDPGLQENSDCGALLQEQQRRDNERPGAPRRQ